LLKMCRRVFVVCCFLAAQISLFDCLFVRRRKESIFDIFDIFVVCEFSFRPSSQQKQTLFKR